MGKSTFFTGEPVLNQLLSLLDRNGIRSIARRGDHDRYFDTYTHLVTMLYCAFNKCTSSREVVSGSKHACINSTIPALSNARRGVPYAMPMPSETLRYLLLFTISYIAGIGIFYRTAD